MTGEKRVALVTGGNKGIGQEVCRQLAQREYTVILSGRDQKRVDEAVTELTGENLDVVGLVVDVTDPTSVAFAEKFVARRYGRLDVLVNNAGVMLDTGRIKQFETTDIERVRESFEINYFGPLRLCLAFVPLMKQQGYGRIVNVSSTMGQLTDSRPDFVGYRSSKTALNQLTRLVALDTEGHDITCNSVCPGWVRTDMGGPEADRSAAEGAETIVWAATLEADGPSGGFFKDKEAIAW